MAEVTIDPNIYITPSEGLLKVIRSIVEPPDQIREVLSRPIVKLTTEDLRWIRNNIDKEDKHRLYALLKESSVAFPCPVYPERNPQLEERCIKLRREQEDREYKAMTRNIRESDLKEKPLSLQFKELNPILIMLVQFIVSVVTSFVFGYVAPYYLWGRSDTGSRIILGTIFAFIVGIAEMYFVIREHLRDDGIEIAKKDA